MPPSMPDEVLIDVNAVPPQFGLHANPPVSFVFLFTKILLIFFIGAITQFG